MAIDTGPLSSRKRSRDCPTVFNMKASWATEKIQKTPLGKAQGAEVQCKKITTVHLLYINTFDFQA